jgi:hypothetical protein
MKKFSTLLLALALSFTLTFPVSAEPSVMSNN